MDTDPLPGLEEVTPTRCPIYRRERHLASAITLTEIHYMLKHRDNPEALRPHHKRMLEDVKDAYILPFPLDTLYARLAVIGNRVMSEVTQSFSPRQEIKVGTHTFIFDAELCLVRLTPLTCFLIPYSLILCFADMCAAWISVDCYASIHNRKYPGYSLLAETQLCFQRMMDLLANLQQKSIYSVQNVAFSHHRIYPQRHRIYT